MDGALARHRHDGLAEALHPLAAAASPQWLAGGLWDEVNGALEYARGGLPARICDK